MTLTRLDPLVLERNIWSASAWTSFRSVELHRYRGVIQWVSEEDILTQLQLETRVGVLLSSPNHVVGFVTLPLLSPIRRPMKPVKMWMGSDFQQVLAVIVGYTGLFHIRLGFLNVL